LPHNNSKANRLGLTASARLLPT